MRSIFFSLLALSALFRPAVSSAAGKARHVVVMVWDGMRPDFVTETNCPTLYRLSRTGVTFTRHHSVYLSATEVNGTAISTGSYPANDGVVGNSEFRPAIDPLKSIHTEAEAAVRTGDKISGGRYLRRPTIAEIVRASGRRTAVAGAKPVAILADRAPRDSAGHGINVFAGVTLPPDYLQALTNQLGAFPKEDSLKPTRNDWTTDALIAQWADGVPDFSFLWMNEPDATQHRTGPGSEQSLAAIRNSDQNLARVLAALETKGVRDVTDLFVVSDHGCSTIFNKADLADGLRRIGLMATREFKSKPAPGEVLIVSNSGSTMVYVIGHHQEVIERVVEFLQAWPHTGVIFTRKPMSGTFPLSQVHLDSGDAPDLVVSMRWTDGKNSNGTAGIVTPDSTSYNSGQGIHVTLSPFDMHATLIAAGPDFRTGTQSTVPSGNVDVAPTVLWILGIKPATKMDGRVLSEALTSPGEPIRESEPRLFQATRKLEGGTWRQYLKVSQVNGVDYFDEGNGAQTPK